MIQKEKAPVTARAYLKATGNHSITVGEVKAKAVGQWNPILAKLAPHLTPALKRPGYHVPCPIHGGKDGFRVFRDVSDTGGGICNTCGSFSNGLDLLQWANNWTYRETIEAVAGYLGISPDDPIKSSPPRQVIKPPQRPDKGKEEAIRQAWSESLPGWHPLSEPLRRYLANRGISLSIIPDAIRFNPSLYCLEDRGRRPAMLSLVSDPEGNPVTLHRTYLTKEGQKAPLSEPKKLMSPALPGSTKGGAIQLFEAGEILAIAEGIETALSVYLDTGLPVWAAISATNMAALVLPDRVRMVLICADNDQAGKKAAAQLANRLIQEGRRVKVALPAHEGEDWNDAYLREVRHV